MEIFSTIVSIVSSIVIAGATVYYAKKTSQIHKANHDSVEAINNQIDIMKDQLAESKRQFDETQRLQFLPCLDMKIEKWNLNDIRKPAYFFLSGLKTDTEYECIRFRFINIGLGSLCKANISVDTPNEKGIVLADNDVVVSPRDEWSFNCNITIEKIGPYDTHGFNVPKCQLIIVYNDLIGNTYRQKADLTFYLKEGSFTYMPMASISAPEFIERAKVGNANP